MRIVYLHGFASSPKSSKAQFFKDRFEQLGVEVTIPDLAEGNFANLTLTGQLRVVKDAAGTGPLIVMGSSMGGYLAALYAARHPEVEKVVALAPAFDFARLWQLRLGAAEMRAWAERGWMETSHYGTGQTEHIGYQLYEDALNYEPFPEIQQSALIIHGVNDDVVPVEVSRNFARGRSNVHLVEVNSGHELTDQVELIWRETRRLLT